jgi:hypothetical protein
MHNQHKREALEAVIKVTKAARGGSRLELVPAFVEIEQDLRAKLAELESQAGTQASQQPARAARAA